MTVATTEDVIEGTPLSPRVVEIREHEAQGDAHQWKAAELIAEELTERGYGGASALAREIGKSEKHVRLMAKVWEKFGPRSEVERPEFREAYRSVKAPKRPRVAEVEEPQDVEEAPEVEEAPANVAPLRAVPDVEEPEEEPQDVEEPRTLTFEIHAHLMTTLSPHAMENLGKYELQDLRDTLLDYVTKIERAMRKKGLRATPGRRP